VNSLDHLDADVLALSGFADAVVNDLHRVNVPAEIVMRLPDPDRLTGRDAIVKDDNSDAGLRK